MLEAFIYRYDRGRWHGYRGPVFVSLAAATRWVEQIVADGRGKSAVTLVSVMDGYVEVAGGASMPPNGPDFPDVLPKVDTREYLA